jgi:hypothetical protein
LTDFHYQMVLSNLAMFRRDSAALPWHLKITTGAVQIGDSTQTSFSIMWPNLSRTFGINGSRGWTESWTVEPEIDGSHLTELQTLYREAAQPETFSIDFDEGDHSGGTPFGRYGNKFVWVKPGHLKGLTKLTLEVLAKIHPSQRGLVLPGLPLR